MKAKILLSLVVALPLVLAGCKQSGDQYVGTWTKVSGNGPDLSILKHDNVFVIKESVQALTGEYPTYAGEMDGDVLVANRGYSTERFIIDKTNGHLIRPGEELEHTSK